MHTRAPNGSGGLLKASYPFTCIKVGTIQRRLAEPLVQRWHAQSGSILTFHLNMFFIFFPHWFLVIFVLAQGHPLPAH